MCREWCILGTLGAPWSLVHVGGACVAWPSPHVYKIRVTEVCPPLTRPLGGGRWRHSLRDPREISGLHKKCARFFLYGGSDPTRDVPFMLAGQPSLHGYYYACMVCWTEGHSG